MVAKIFTFIFILAIGICMLKYTKNIHSITGRIGWAEKYLGIGGTVTAIKLGGLLAILGSIIYLVN